MKGTSGIYEFRETIMRFYRRQEFVLRPVFRFVVSLALLLLLRAHLGVHGAPGAALGSTLLNVILALACSMLPPGFAAGIIALVMVWDLYRLSLEATAICAALLLVCLLVYFRFSPRDVMVLLIMPVAYALNLHYAVPVLAGLLFGPGTAVPVIFGLLFTRYVLLVEESLPVIGTTSPDAPLVGEKLLENFRTLIDGMAGDKNLIVLAAALAAAAVLVCFIRNLAVEYSWVAAITAGCVIELVILMAGDMRFDTGLDFGRMILGILLSFVIAQVVRFFLHNADYLRAENVQFEDEDYFYYVKAVPKVMYLPPAPLDGEEENDPFDPS